MIGGIRGRRAPRLPPAARGLGAVLDHVHHGEQVVLAAVDLLPDELVRVRRRPGVAPSPAHKRLAVLGVVPGDPALGVPGEEGVEGCDSGLAVNRGQGVDIP